MDNADSELLALIKGHFIGGGTYREAWQYLPDTSMVIKIEKEPYKFDNVTEWNLYNFLKDLEYGKWLAICRTISPNGTVMIMERTRPVPASLLPKMIPSIFHDTKAENWGLVIRNGKKLYVCHDYAHYNAVGIPKKVKLVKASWHNPEYAGWTK